MRLTSVYKLCWTNCACRAVTTCRFLAILTSALLRKPWHYSLVVRTHYADLHWTKTSFETKLRINAKP